VLLLNSSKFPCTKRFRVGKPDGYSKNGTLDLYFAKNQNNNFMVIFESDPIMTGNVYFYLDNNSIITLVDKGIIDNIGESTYKIYYLTLNEVNKITSSNIKCIRYTYINFFMEKINEVVKNEDYYKYSSTDGLSNVKRVDFNEVLKSLLQN
jgi:hypothetical protein